jgi:hypothetical protein
MINFGLKSSVIYHYSVFLFAGVVTLVQVFVTVGLVVLGQLLSLVFAQFMQRSRPVKAR